MSKTILDLNLEIKSIKKIQIEENLEMKILGTLKGTLEASLINRLQRIERIRGGLHLLS